MNTNKPSWIIVHDTGGTDENPKESTQHHTFEIVNYHHFQKWAFKSSLGWYIGYHYFIDAQGKLTQGRADTEEGAHTIGMNKDSIGICLAGNFDGVDTPTAQQIETLTGLLNTLTAKWNIPLQKIVPHRHFAPDKTCFGTSLRDTWARDLLADRWQKKITILRMLLELYLRLLDELRRRKTQVASAFARDKEKFV